MPRIALVTLARDEAPRIGRLLDSVAPWVDTMLVLDTGSVDDTPAIARRHGARVEHLPWPDDFAAARNAALDLCRADWHLVLDADEWLADGGAALQAAPAEAPGFVGALRFDDSFDDAGGARQAQHWLSRLLPGAVRYQGRVHEQPVHGLPVRRLAVTIGHDGYRAERLAAKRGRNRRLLEASLAERPRDAYLWYQLGKDHDVYEAHAEAAEALLRAAKLARGDEPWWDDLVVRRLFTLKRLKRHADAMDLADAQMPFLAESPDFFFAIGDVLLDLAAEQPEQAGHALAMAETAWRHCLAIGERPERPHGVAGRGSHLAAHNLALVLDFAGRRDEAAALRREHGVGTPA